MPCIRFPFIRRGSNSLEYAFCVPHLSHGIFIRPSRVRIFPVKQCKLPTAITSLATKSDTPPLSRNFKLGVRVQFYSILWYFSQVLFFQRAEVRARQCIHTPASWLVQSMESAVLLSAHHVGHMISSSQSTCSKIHVCLVYHSLFQLPKAQSDPLPSCHHVELW